MATYVVGRTRDTMIIEGKIDNFQEKLDGKIPVTWADLVLLVDSWGREEITGINYQEDRARSVYFEKKPPKECYDLSNLDVSNIRSFANLFENSNFNGDISKWDVSNGTNFKKMFQNSKFNGNITNWDMSSAVDISRMFSNAHEFNQPLNWDIPNVEDSYKMFENNKKFESGVILSNLNNESDKTDTFVDVDAFEKKFNNGKSLPSKTEPIIKWLEDNKEKMIEKDPILKVRIEEKNIKNNLIKDNSINNETIKKTTTNEVIKETEDLLNKINKEIESSKVKLEELKAIKENLENKKSELELNKIGIDR